MIIEKIRAKIKAPQGFGVAGLGTLSIKESEEKKMLNLYEVKIVTNKRSKEDFYTGENPKEAREDAKHYFRIYDMEEEYIFGCITRLVNSDL